MYILISGWSPVVRLFRIRNSLLQRYRQTLLSILRDHIKNSVFGNSLGHVLYSGCILAVQYFCSFSDLDRWCLSRPRAYLVSSPSVLTGHRYFSKLPSVMMPGRVLTKICTLLSHSYQENCWLQFDAPYHTSYVVRTYIFTFRRS